tara:strand:- start:278 stop:730 length:453 start_codon:yes stop_codon:yes gene_type:complete
MKNLILTLLTILSINTYAQEYDSTQFESFDDQESYIHSALVKPHLEMLHEIVYWGWVIKPISKDDTIAHQMSYHCDNVIYLESKFNNKMYIFLNNNDRYTEGLAWINELLIESNVPYLDVFTFDVDNYSSMLTSIDNKEYYFINKNVNGE